VKYAVNTVFLVASVSFIAGPLVGACEAVEATAFAVALMFGGLGIAGGVVGGNRIMRGLEEDASIAMAPAESRATGQIK
jgi:hypothetical protein